jgi:mitochondrial fission protein ELM1
MALVDAAAPERQSPPMSTPPPSWILTEPYAGLQSQGLGLAEAAGLAPEIRVLEPRAPWKWLTARLWPNPAAVFPPETLAPPVPDIIFGCGGTGAVAAASLRAPDRKIIAIQHPRMDIRKFSLVIVNPHDGLTGPNVLIVRTALHRITEERLAAARMHWADRFAHLPRPLVAVLLGGSNGRFRLTTRVAADLAARLAEMARRDQVGLVVTPSRRTDPTVTRLFAEMLNPLGAWVWDGTGENPYFGMLALSDMIIVTEDSVSMVSEAVATTAPVMLARLPGRSRRIGQFMADLLASGRIKDFATRYEPWPVTPMNDTQEAATEMRRRLGF